MIDTCSCSKKKCVRHGIVELIEKDLVGGGFLLASACGVLRYPLLGDSQDS
jgi:hypothetical protein